MYIDSKTRSYGQNNTINEELLAVARASANRVVGG
jgi:hypothetical protein